MKKIGKVTHYYGKIGVAIVELVDGLKVGDRVKIEGGKAEFEQEVSSMQIDHKDVPKAKKGDVIGLKVAEKVKEGALVYLLQEEE